MSRVPKRAQTFPPECQSSSPSEGVGSTGESLTQRLELMWGRSIFAATYAMVSFWRIWTSGHGFLRKCALMILTLYSEWKVLLENAAPARTSSC